jgi:pyruvate/2-oxoglutarate dehydrogenase complex dihydrolipoamide acyltransferase (E2) component
VRVVQWLVDLGAEVVAGDRVLEVVSLGVVFSVSAPCSGVVTACVVAIDKLVHPGDRLGTIAADQDAEDV